MRRVTLLALLATAFLVTAGTAFANTTFTVSENGNQFIFTTNLSSVVNLSGANISSSIVSDTFVPMSPTQDNLGFTLGSPASQYSLIELASGFNLVVTTDASGTLTALTMGGVYFASFPAVPGENPNDFFCTYNAPTGSLITDNDAGLCPATATTNVDFGTQGTGTSTPEPSTFYFLSGGAALLLRKSRRRKRA